MGDLTKEQKSILQDLEKKILTHFQIEGEALTKFYIAEDNLESMKQNVAKNLGEVDDSTKSYLTSLDNQKESLRLQAETIEKDRDSILQVSL